MLEKISGLKCNICKTIYEENQEISQLCREGIISGPDIKGGFMLGRNKNIYTIIFKTRRNGHECKYSNDSFCIGHFLDKLDYNSISFEDIKQLKEKKSHSSIRLLDDEEFLHASKIILKKHESFLKETLGIEKLYNHHPYFE